MSDPAVHTPDDVTLGELHRNIVGLTLTMNQRFTETNSRIDAAAGQYLRADVYESDTRQTVKRISDIEERLRWLGRQLAIVAIGIPGAAATAWIVAHSVK